MRLATAILAIASLAPPAAAKSGFITTSDGVRLHYLEAGSGPAIVFVPGWTMPAEIWERQIAYFSKAWRVVALDPRSQGLSGQPAEGHYPERRAQDIKELVDRLKLAPAVLVGWSMGVPEVITYVHQFGTSTVRGIVLVDGFMVLPPNIMDSLRQFMMAVQTERLKFTDQFVRGMYKKRQPEEYLKKVVAASLKTPTNTAVTLFANAASVTDWRPRLAKMDKPVLYMITAQLQAHGDALKEKIPSAQVEHFPDSGHALFVDEPDRFNSLLEKFLEKIRQ